MIRLPTQLLLMIGVLCLSMSVAAQQSLRLPEMGSTTTRVLSPEEERTFARDFERYLRANKLLIEDPLIRDYFDEMGFRLVSFSTRNNAPFRFFVIRDPSINAFAAPAGVIGLHSGLILTAHTEAEIAGVVAHEIAHVTQDHLARAMEAQQSTSLPTMLATLALAVAAGAAGSPDASQAVLLSGMGLAQQFSINHTRQNEAEADRVGIGLLATAGYDPKGMAAFFERLNMASRAMGQGPPEYLRTHPLTINRVAEARSRAQQMTVRDPRSDERFHFIQARLRVLMSRRAHQAIDWFRLRLEQEDRPADAMRYGLTLALARARRFDEAHSVLGELLEAGPERQLYRLLEGEVLLSEGRDDEALETLAELYRSFPGSRQVTTQYAETLMYGGDSDRAARAATIIRAHLRDHPHDLRMTELLAQAADRSGDEVRATEALAESYYLRGGVSEAIEQLEKVLERNDLDYYQRARITARLNEFRSLHLRRMNTGR
ncbi:M48 family metalloprotease [Wenzhouxiangella limi]|uniref:Putative beta-barrel assembly-enhancing protease n=1 Tax=Wenzhouxiangella limi TaxID=2707351 RepID=A0A845VHR4_9GAMM|nr:M48 family metalloprotease [Wenzhouxiangella limi]NDY96729.1 M48 family metallopeptidase [Wenzhouxiangella limi]